MAWIDLKMSRTNSLIWMPFQYVFVLMTSSILRSRWWPWPLCHAPFAYHWRGCIWEICIYILYFSTLRNVMPICCIIPRNKGEENISTLLFHGVREECACLLYYSMVLGKSVHIYCMIPWCKKRVYISTVRFHDMRKVCISAASFLSYSWMFLQSLPQTWTSAHTTSRAGMAGYAPTRVRVGTHVPAWAATPESTVSGRWMTARASPVLTMASAR